MKLADFKYELPDELIAQYPPDKRDESKLMVLNKKNGEIEHQNFPDVLDFFEKDDVLVVNETKVFPARLYGYKEK
ncbi:MAG: S-adenosylmethionine:tRNA ribosyltransferase-isomerase, partial [Calditrichia bacterium]|nr:S-adenosylmethionine:tRNA ribosyltransferase-isomerase [Calditrichia bacterium]